MGKSAGSSISRKPVGPETEETPVAGDAGASEAGDPGGVDRPIRLNGVRWPAVPHQKASRPLRAKVLYLKGQFRCRGYGRKGRAVCSANGGDRRVSRPHFIIGSRPARSFDAVAGTKLNQAMFRGLVLRHAQWPATAPFAPHHRRYIGSYSRCPLYASLEALASAGVPVRVADNKPRCRPAHTGLIPNPTHRDRWIDRGPVPGRSLPVQIEPPLPRAAARTFRCYSSRRTCPTRRLYKVR